MKVTDKIRRAIFKISAEGATLFEWCIWVSLLTLVVGLPIVMAILNSIGKSLFVVITTGLSLFLLTYILLTITNKLLEVWPFRVSMEEMEFEQDYEPRIPE